MSRARQHALLVFQIGFGHFNGTGGGRIKGRAAFQQANNFCTAIACALDDIVNFLLRCPFHFHQIRQGNTGNGRIAHRWNHCVAMPAQHKGGHIFDGDIKLLGKEMTEARRVQHASHADHFIFRQAGEFLQRPDHRIQRIGDTNHKSIGRIFFNALAHLLHHFQIDFNQIIAAHARLARHTCGDNHHISALDLGIGFCAFQRSVKMADRRALRQIQCLALRNTVNNVENDNIAKFLETGQMRQRAADLTTTDKCYFVASHVFPRKCRPSGRVNICLWQRVVARLGAPCKTSCLFHRQYGAIANSHGFAFPSAATRCVQTQTPRRLADIARPARHRLRPTH